MKARLGAGVALVVLWVLMWGELSVANVLSGALVAAALLVVFPFEHHSSGAAVVRPVALAKLTGYFLVQLLVSNVQLTRAILTRDSGMTTDVVVYPLAHRSDRVLTVLSSLLSLTPGIMPVAVDAAPHSVSVHVLRFGGDDDVIPGIARLERLVVDALGAEPPGPAPGGAGPNLARPDRWSGGAR